MLKFIPEIMEFCRVTCLEVEALDSTNIRPDHWTSLAAAIRDHYDAFDGFIITHGTDTMAYTSSALSYLIQNSAKPIVLTGAQRPIWATGSDAPKNLLDAFYFAANGAMGGVFIVFGGRAILGTRARKVKTMSYSAFSSINFPTVAYLHYRKVTSYIDLKPEGKVKFFEKLNPRVCLIKLTPGMPPDVLAYLAKSNDALIVESFGSGGLPFSFHETARSISGQGIPIILSTQVTFEGSDLDAYEVGGRIASLPGVIETHDMTVESALTKIMWILPQVCDFGKIRELFYRPIARDIDCPQEAD